MVSATTATFGIAPLDLARRFDAGEIRQADVHEDDVRRGPAGKIDGLGGRAGFAHDLDIRLSAEQHLQP